MLLLPQSLKPWLFEKKIKTTPTPSNLSDSCVFPGSAKAKCARIAHRQRRERPLKSPRETVLTFLSRSFAGEEKSWTTRFFVFVSSSRLFSHHPTPLPVPARVFKNEFATVKCVCVWKSGRPKSACKKMEVGGGGGGGKGEKLWGGEQFFVGGGVKKQMKQKNRGKTSSDSGEWLALKR